MQMINYELHAEQDVSPFHALHGSSKGCIDLVHLDKSVKPTGHRNVTRRYSTLVRHHLASFCNEYDNQDIYFSLNTFKKAKRNRENLLELKALYIDVDYYKEGYTQQQTLAYIDDLIKNNTIPIPTYIIDSGRGMYLIWKIHMAPPQALPRWKNLMDYLYSHLKDYGADAKCLEPSRFLRLNGSIHRETKKVVSTISYTPITYNLYNLRNDYSHSHTKKEPSSNLPVQSNSTKTITRKGKYKFRKNANVLYLQNQYKTYEKRLQDLTKLAELRKYDMRPYHCREMMCFLTRYWTYCTTRNDELALQKALELNASFKEPLLEQEVIKVTAINEKVKKLQAYCYGNAKLIEILSISEAEQYQLQTIHTNVIRLKKIDDDRKKARRNDNGFTAKEQKSKDNQEQIISLTKENYTTKQISEKIGLSVRQVQRIKKALGLF